MKKLSLIDMDAEGIVFVAFSRVTAKRSRNGIGYYRYILEKITDEQKAEFARLNVNVPNTLKYYKVTRIEQLTSKQADYVIEAKRKAVERDEN